MSKRPFLVRAQANLIVPQGFAGIWKVMLDLDAKGPFTRRQIEFETIGYRSMVTNYLSKLKRAGIVVEVEHRAVNALKPEMALKLTRRPVKPPRLAADGSELPEPFIQTIWRTMRMLKIFTPTEISDAASSPDRPIHITTVRCYLSILRKAGVIVRVSTKGRASDAACRLVKDLGPDAPMVLKARALWDPNTSAVLLDPEVSEVTS